jgi:hypothetical protein
MSEYDDKYEGMSLKQLAEAQAQVKTEMEHYAGIKASLQQEFDALRKHIVPAKMEEMGIESVRIEGVGTLSLAVDAYCSTPADKRQALMDWLESHNAGDLITTTVNASTLKAFMKEQATEGNELPDMVKFEPYTYSKITGSRK